MSYHFKSIRMANIRKKENSVIKDVEKLKFLCIIGGNIK